MAKKRLISSDVDVADDAMPDYLYAMMLNVKEAFISYAGAQAVEYYDYTDLMRFAIRIYQTDHPGPMAFSMPNKRPE